MNKTNEVVVHMWTRLLFPLWREPRPQFECFEEVKKILAQRTNSAIRSNFEVLKANGERKAWLEWIFDRPLDERQRLAVQSELENCFGQEQGRNFCWDGSSAKTEIFSSLAIGPHIQ